MEDALVVGEAEGRDTPAAIRPAIPYETTDITGVVDRVGEDQRQGRAA